MPLIVKPAAETDIPRILEIHDAAFAHDSWQRIMKPNMPPPHSRIKAIERFRNEFRHDPAAHFLVAEDKDRDELVAFAKWNVYKTERPESEWKKKPDIEWDEGKTGQQLHQSLLRPLSGRFPRFNLTSSGVRSEQGRHRLLPQQYSEKKAKKYWGQGTPP